MVNMGLLITRKLKLKAGRFMLVLESPTSLSSLSGVFWISLDFSKWDKKGYMHHFSSIKEARLISAYWHLDRTLELNLYRHPDDSFYPSDVTSWNMLHTMRSLSGASELFGAFSPSK
jgi:hypothetical protein